MSESPRLRPFPRERLARHAPEAALTLLGALLVRREAGEGSSVARIVEVEAYREDDPASHSARGRTPRNAAMFGPPGVAYVYRSYGSHWCLNVSAEGDGVGAAVLLRAAELVGDVAASPVWSRRTDVRHEAALLRGPGCLTRGLDIDAPRHDGADLLDPDGEVFLALPAGRLVRPPVRRGPRVGVSRAAEVPWRFWIDGAVAVSAYRRSPRAPHPARHDREAGTASA